MEPRDVPVVAAIDRLSFPTPWPAAAFRRELERERATYSVLLRPEESIFHTSVHQKGGWLRQLFNPAESSRVIGYVGFRLQDSGGHITTIALHPDWRGRGFGDLLLSVALERMVERGVDAVTLEMRPSNDVAYQLYQKYGFQVVQTRRDYYRDGEDAWLMMVNVSDPAYRQRLAVLRGALEERFHRQDIDVGQIIGDAL
jgi:ribosomal-protein-alanine N-acetyltransferase